MQQKYNYLVPESKLRNNQFQNGTLPSCSNMDTM
jgi:hypothetical protein